MNPDLMNAVLVITRKEEVGREDGTPIVADTEVQVRGWFDEPAMASNVREANRDPNIPTAVRRALFGCLADADVRQDDRGMVVFATGQELGPWTVEMDMSVPTPDGMSHREVTLLWVGETG